MQKQHSEKKPHINEKAKKIINTLVLLSLIVLPFYNKKDILNVYNNKTIINTVIKLYHLRIILPWYHNAKGVMALLMCRGTVKRETQCVQYIGQHLSWIIQWIKLLCQSALMN